MSETHPEPRLRAIELLALHLAEAMVLPGPALQQRLRDDARPPALARFLASLAACGFSLIDKAAWHLQAQGEGAALGWLADLNPLEQAELATLQRDLEASPSLLAGLRQLLEQPAGPPVDAEPMRIAKGLLRILQRPRSAEEARLEGATERALQGGLRHLRQLAHHSLAARIEKLLPVRRVLERRRTALTVDGGELERPDGSRVSVRPFLIGRRPLGRPGVGRIDALRAARAAGWRLPGYEQLLWLVRRPPRTLSLPATRRAWLRAGRRHQGRLYGAALQLKAPHKRFWLPGHLPGPELVVYGVLDLHG